MEVAIQKTAGLVEQTQQGISIRIAEILGQDQIVAAFLKRSLGNVQESCFIRAATSLEAFSNVRRYGDSRPL